MLQIIQDEVVACRRCPRLVEWRERIGVERRAAFRDQSYWARPVPAWGDPGASLMILGLAPAAHGANRTGRMFTGDRSGDFLYAALHRAGLANQPTSVSRDDGLKLRGVYISAALRCAPPANKPTPRQLDNCRPYLVDELRLLQPHAIVCLGSIAWNAALASVNARGFALPRPRPKFGHAAEVNIGETTLLGCYHVSQQNTFTGRLTPAMLDGVLRRAIALSSETSRIARHV
ncbi:MAG TPA: uracil-DNA glycosylase [Phycisphaerales bacterium]|nr:uracil-DNA glycosylase [Phycisphaerales bacterium]